MNENSSKNYYYYFHNTNVVQVFCLLIIIIIIFIAKPKKIKQQTNTFHTWKIRRKKIQKYVNQKSKKKY